MTQSTNTRRPRIFARQSDDATVQGTSIATRPVAKCSPKTNAAATTKAAGVVTFLQRGEGATLQDLVDATGWLPHTTRAFLTGLRKKGHAVVRTQADDGVSVYRLVPPVPEVAVFPPDTGDTDVGATEAA